MMAGEVWLAMTKSIAAKMAPWSNRSQLSKVHRRITRTAQHNRKETSDEID